MKRVARFALAAFAGVVVSFSALAGDKTWTGNAGDGDYLNPKNWDPQEVPENGSKGYFKNTSPSVTLYATNGQPCGRDHPCAVRERDTWRED